MNEKEKLEQFLDSDFDTKAESFVVDDKSKANWCIRKIAQCDQELADVQKLVKAEKEKLDIYLKSQTDICSTNKEYFESKLAPFIAEQLEGKKERSIKLPNGTAGFRKQQPTIEKDDTKLLNFTKASMPEFIKIKESVNWADMKKELVLSGSTYVTKDGEVVDGVKVTPAEPDKFYVKVGGIE